MNIVIPDKIDFSKKHREILQSLGNVTVHEDTNNDKQVIIDRIKNAELITANYIDITESIIQNSPKTVYFDCCGIARLAHIDQLCELMKVMKRRQSQINKR